MDNRSQSPGETPKLTRPTVSENPETKSSGDLEAKNRGAPGLLQASILPRLQGKNQPEFKDKGERTCTL